MEESLRIGAKIIDFSGKLHGCIATENSILTTTDFGNNWQLSVHALNKLFNMDFLNSKDGYIIAKDWMLQNHFLLKTSDGGENWLNVNLPDSLDQGWQGLNSTYFVEENIGFIGADNKIYKTIDGGNNWYESILEVKRSYYPIDVIYFYDKQNGWAISGQENTNFIYSTNDYGETWEMVSLNDSSFYNDIVFINSEIGFIVGVEKLYKTINGGVDWECNNLEGYWFNDIEQITPSLGYVCGYYYSNGGQIMNNFIYCSNDGWEDQTNWIKQLKVKNSKFNSIEMIDSLVGFVCGFIIDDNYQINGIIYHTSDGGKNWEENYTIVDTELNDIQFIDENTGWAVGENGISIKNHKWWCDMG